MSAVRSFFARKMGASLIDLTIELSGGILGSYFGAMVAALLAVMDRDVNPEVMQNTMKSGFGLGFIFWTLGVSFLNRVLIQGISRASIGKKFFHLELISIAGPLTWSTMVGRWALSMGSLVLLGGGYFYALFSKEQRALHDVLTQTDIIPELDSVQVRIEPKVADARSEEALRLMIISNAQAERPSATVIRLPLKKREVNPTADPAAAAPVESPEEKKKAS